MPIIFVNMIEGKTLEQKKKLVNEMAETIMRTIDVPKEKVTIFLNEYKRCSVARNGIMYSDMD